VDFLTAEAPSAGLYIAERFADRFLVRENGGAHSGTPFSYRIVAKRKDVHAVRLERVTPPRPTRPPAYKSGVYLLTTQFPRLIGERCSRSGRSRSAGRPERLTHTMPMLSPQRHRTPRPRPSRARWMLCASRSSEYVSVTMRRKPVRCDEIRIFRNHRWQREMSITTAPVDAVRASRYGWAIPLCGCGRCCCARSGSRCRARS
jgi:hypothetical protein